MAHQFRHVADLDVMLESYKHLITGIGGTAAELDRLLLVVTLQTAPGLE